MNNLDSDIRCERVRKSDPVYLISMFCSCPTLNLLSKKNEINLSYSQFRFYDMLYYDKDVELRQDKYLLIYLYF